MLAGEVPFKGDSAVSVAMKHVREGLPDVQRRRPEVSAALAAVLERATAKELREPLRVDGRLRARPRGGADLRDRPRRARRPARRRRCCSAAARRGVARRGARRRRIARLARCTSLIAAAVAVGAALLIVNGDDEQNAPAAAGDLTRDPARRARRRTTTTRRPATARRTPSTLALALDGDPTTAWETENYDTPDLGNIKDGVGLYLDAGRPVVARGAADHHAEGGLEVRALRRGNSVPARRCRAGRWSASGEMDADAQDVQPRHRAASASRYYLSGSRSLTEGATGGSNAAISELELLG